MLFFFCRNGTPGRIRTCDPLVRSQILYPAELQVQTDLDFRVTVFDLQAGETSKIFSPVGKPGIELSNSVIFAEILCG